METIKIFAVAKKKKVRFTGYCSLLNIPGGSDSNKSACNTGDLGSFPGLGNRSSGDGNGNPLQYSCLESSMYGGTCRATVHGVTKSQTQLSD